MKRSILVAENYEESLILLQDWLTQKGYGVLSARIGAEAVTLARDLRPRLAILDYAMPGTNGIAVARAIREAPETRHIPIIMMTSIGITTPTDDAALNGFDGLFPKPFDLKTLFEKIRELLGKPRVLVIDDEEFYRDIISRSLSATCTVVTANDGKQGMKLAVREDPDLVIVDRSMPDRRGDEVAADIIKQCGIPVMMATGDVLQDIERVKLTAIGVKTLLAKPFEITDLQTSVAALLPQFFPPLPTPKA